MAMVLHISVEDGEWFASGVPYQEGVVYADIIEVHPADLPALCDALDMVPRRALEIVAERCNMLETGLTKLDDYLRENGLDRSRSYPTLIRQIMAWALAEGQRPTKGDAD